MDFYSRKNLWKFLLLLFAVLIGMITLLYTESFLLDLRNEEVKKVNQWANAMAFVQRADNNTDLTLAGQIIGDNTTIPVIIVDGDGDIVATNNINLPKNNEDEY